MKTILNPSVKEFSSNKPLLKFYSKRQLEALYQLLMSRKFGPKLMRMLASKGLISLDIEVEEDYLGFDELTYIVNIYKEN